MVADKLPMTAPRDHPPVWVTYVSLIFSLAALAITGLVAYRGTLKPFMLRLWVDPIVQVQHKVNFGIYADLSFRNESPRSGLITNLLAILSKVETPEDKYLLNFASFRASDSDGIYRESEETMPVFVAPGQWVSRTVSFVYMNPEQFPISMGTYACEVLVWTDYEQTARYRQSKRFEVNADVLNTYLACRDKGLTRLQAIPTVGAIPLTARKLSPAEYEALVR